jgi:hypothetical protein
LHLAVFVGVPIKRFGRIIIAAGLADHLAAAVHDGEFIIRVGLNAVDL